MGVIANPSDVRAALEGYGVDASTLTDAWIDDELDNFAKPYLENLFNQPIGSEAQVTEYFSPPRGPLLLLNRKPVVSVDSMKYIDGAALTSYITITTSGMVRLNTGCFTQGVKNLEVVLTVGLNPIPEAVKKAAIYLVAAAALSFIADRDGGATSLSVVSYSESYPAEGAYSNVLKNLIRKFKNLIKPYTTGVK